MELNHLIFVLSYLVIGGSCNDKIWFEGDIIPGTNYTVGSQDPPEWIRFALPAENVVSPSSVVVSRGVGRLALHLQSVIGTSGKNTVFSPLSVALAMALVLLGAKERTYQEITTVLGLSNNTDTAIVQELHQIFGSLFQTLEKNSDNGDGIILTLASGVFVQKDFPINPVYSETAKSLYKGEVMSLDFQFRAKEARDTINRWVENRTDGHIMNLITEPLSVDTRVVMVNAIFFNGNWETPFPSEFTKPKNFYIDSTNYVEVDMMVNVGDAYFYADNEKKVLGLPYKGRDTIMYFVRPTYDLNDFVASATPQQLLQMVQNSTIVMTTYSVPKMKLEATLSLKKALEDLGVKTLFNPYEANLSGLAQGVYVNSVLQKVEVIVTETGTTASAATVLDLVRSGGPSIRLDKPFLFFIYDVPSRLVSFWGTVYHPTKI